MPPRHMKGPNLDKPKNFKGTMKTLAKYISRYKVSLIFVAVFAIGSTVFSIIGPKILGNATTELFNGIVSKLQGGEGIDFDAIARILVFLIVLYAVSAAFSYIQGFLMTGVTQKLTYRMRKEISEKIHRMPFNYFDEKNHGEVLSVITNDVDTLSQSMGQAATQVVTSSATLIGVLIMMLSIDWLMTLITLFILPVTLLLVSLVVKKSQPYFKKQQEYLGHVNGQIEEVFGAQNIVRAFNAEERTIGEFKKDNHILFNCAWKSQFLSGLMQPVMNFIGNISYVLVAIIGGYLAVNGRITVGNIQSFIQYSRQFTQPISTLAQVSNMLQSTAASAERIFDFLAVDEEEQIVSDAVSVEGLRGNVTFSNVKFGYVPEKIIINDFSAEVREGQKIAIVGPTGAGKTTIIKLLMRFYDVNGGAILVDGNDIRRFNRSELRNMFGMVLQDTWLFNGSIMENIRYGRDDATDEEVIAAARSANADHFIRTLPGGYELELNEEATNVSQGQKQLLTIARAILADPKILILDEATSSVDTRTEEQIQKAMDNLMRGRTSFVIAHRLSTIRDADLILAMNNGDIVEQGTHEELLAKNGFYAEIYNSQFEKISAV